MVTSVRLPDELERAVLAYAERHDVSKSTAMRMLMENGLAREDMARDVTDLEDRLDAMEETLTTVVTAVERIQSAVDAESSPAESDAADPAGKLESETGNYADPTGVPTIPGGPESPPVPTQSANEGTTQQAGIAQWNDAGDATHEEVTDGGQPTERPPADRS
jgi:predicted DNA-binding protein